MKPSCLQMVVAPLFESQNACPQIGIHLFFQKTSGTMSLPACTAATGHSGRQAAHASLPERRARTSPSFGDGGGGAWHFRPSSLTDSTVNG